MLPPFLRRMVPSNYKDKAHVMIKFGIGEKEHAGEAVSDVLCKNCGHTQHVSFGISRYFHMFWIPLLITSKQVGLRCSNCKKMTTNDEVPREVALRARKNIFTALRALPLYSGSIIVLLLLSSLYFAHLDNEKDERALLESPRMHDVYFADLTRVFPDQEFGQFPFGAMRILSVSNEGILFAISKESFNDVLVLSKNITRNGGSDTFYGGKTIFISNEDVVKLYDAETLRSITRDFRPVDNSKPIQW